MTFKATKNADGSYTCTVPSNVSKVILGIKGDVNSDGRVNIGDVSRLYAHVKGGSQLTGDALFVGDVNNDNRNNIGDVSRLYAHAKGTPLTWDT